MLPDLRIVIAAVLSTFVVTAGVGFYASSRLIQEPKRTDSLAAMDETPVNRIALSWPAPTRQPEQPALDFAVTAKALRNPVRDITNDTAAAWQPPQQSAAVTADRSDATSPALKSRASVRAEPVAPAVPIASAPVPVAATPISHAAEALQTTAKAAIPAPAPDIRIAVQYPPIAELPPELRVPVPAPVMAIPQAAPVAEAASPAKPDPITTGSVVEALAAPGTATPDRAKPDPTVAIRTEPKAGAAASEGVETTPETRPAAKPAAKRKKASPKKAAKRPVVRRQAVAPADTFPFNFFGTNLSN